MKSFTYILCAATVLMTNAAFAEFVQLSNSMTSEQLIAAQDHNEQKAEGMIADGLTSNDPEAVLQGESALDSSLTGH